MPKVKMKVSMAGSEFSYVPGDIIDVRDDVAEAWVTNDIADIFVPPEEKVIVHKEEPIEEDKTESVEGETQETPTEEEKAESVEEETSKEEVKPKASPKEKVTKDANTK
ncbi:hypothetical protein [Bacillus sp. UNCCL81]|uniref:hypothetical protein n=1 Tax=Bacillus sp. UNCCL81 TaxID=1502755 RepID=UPI0008DEF7E2|nr:hypothetical protein [Bacillus sp. UNCCL81]SFC52422.1 hypothetical protein SAMN02799633_01088 [Bacillus sp. UNCCL81]